MPVDQPAAKTGPCPSRAQAYATSQGDTSQVATCNVAGAVLNQGNEISKCFYCVFVKTALVIARE
jgi:hypothetical protein